MVHHVIPLRDLLCFGLYITAGWQVAKWDDQEPHIAIGSRVALKGRAKRLRAEPSSKYRLGRSLALPDGSFGRSIERSVLSSGFDHFESFMQCFVQRFGRDFLGDDFPIRSDEPERGDGA